MPPPFFHPPPHPNHPPFPPPPFPHHLPPPPFPPIFNISESTSTSSPISESPSLPSTGETDYTYEEEPVVEVVVDYEYPEQESDYEAVETLPADKYSDYEYNDYEEPPKVTKSEELAPIVPGKGQPWSF